MLHVHLTAGLGAVLPAAAALRMQRLPAVTGGSSQRFELQELRQAMAHVVVPEGCRRYLARGRDHAGVVLTDITAKLCRAGGYTYDDCYVGGRASRAAGVALTVCWTLHASQAGLRVRWAS